MNSGTSVVRVLIVDDQALFREALATLLEVRPEIEVVGEAANGDEAIRQSAVLHPDVVLMDLHMPVLDGIAATQRLRADKPEVRVLAPTTFDDDDDVFAALRAGAVGYLLKDVSSDRLVEGVGRGVARRVRAATVRRRQGRRPVHPTTRRRRAAPAPASAARSPLVGPGARGAATARRRVQQSRDRRRIVSRRGNGQEPRHEPADETQRPGPDPGRAASPCARPGVTAFRRDRTGHATS
jgi:DNA-binding NarL/FixJ family response regulator